MKKQFTLTAVQALPGHKLNLTYADGQVFCLSVLPLIRRSRVLSPLHDAALFNQASVGEFGGCVAFGDDDNLELAADNLRARAIEQGGGYSHEYLFNWMSRHGLTQQAAADALGISRRMLGYYLSGAKPLPRVVALACEGWEARLLRAA